MTPATVLFDVGGTIYRVAKSLLDKYPETILAKMASKTWCQVQAVTATTTGENCTDGANEKDSADSETGTKVECSNKNRNRKDEDQPMFIERDRDRFQYILDYMRDRRVMIPSNGRLTKESMMAEFQYYGFDVPESAIEVSTYSPCELAEHLASVEKEHQAMMLKIDYEKACRKLAHYCFCVFREKLKSAFSFNFEVSFSSATAKPEVSFGDVTMVASAYHRKDKDTNFDECLAFFGLKCLTITATSGNVIIELAKRES